MAKRRPRKGTNCRTGCPTRDHYTWGECARASNVALGPLGGYRDGGKDWGDVKAFRRETERYRQATRDGLEPSNVTNEAVDAAYRAADKEG